MLWRKFKLRQGERAKRGPLRENDRPLDEVFEFANIARPIPPSERLHNVRRNRFDLSIHAAGVLSDEVADEQRNVLAALPQRRDRDGENSQAVVEVAAKLAVGNHLFQVAIRGRDEAHVDRNRARAAQPFEFFFLQSAQELGLKFGRKVAHFVEKQSALMSQFQPSDFLGDRTGKGASFMAKQLAFEQAGGDRGTVQLDESPFAARAEIVDRAGNQVFSGAGFAQDQNRDVGGGDRFHLLQDSPQDRTITDNVLEAVLGVKLLFEIALFLFFSFQGLLGFHLFGKIADHAEHETPRGGFDRAEHDVDRKFGAILAAAMKIESDAHGPRLGTIARIPCDVSGGRSGIAPGSESRPAGRLILSRP